MSFLGEWHRHQKAQKDAERDRKNYAFTILHNYRGDRYSIREIEESRTLKEAEREQRISASNKLHGYRHTEHDGKKYGRSTTKEWKQKSVRERTKYGVPDVSVGSKRDGNDFSARKSREVTCVDFSFGLIYQDWEPRPGIDSCTMAASVIIPHMVGQWSNDAKVFCDPQTPEIVGEISTDDWYDSEDSIRYVVRGTVPVYVFTESSEKESILPLQKALKCHVSFRPISASEAEGVTKDKRRHFILGDKGTQQWIRVREGRLGGLGITF
eukprot:jgi/Psemu1/43486/gm1.43486_g